jgi:dipeptidyl aminopeptidase/acylaminoacyl peptidase
MGGTVTTPPPKPRTTGRADHDQLEALIEEARRRARRRRQIYCAVALLALAAGAGTYLLFAHRGGSTTPSPSAGPAPLPPVSGPARNGPLTIISHALPVASIDEIVGGRSKTIWRCPHDIWCGESASIDWAPDGRRIALTLDEIGGTSGYVGLHVVDIESGRDTQIPAGAPADAADDAWLPYLGRMLDRVGCFPATDLDWSPDGSRLAYRCGSRINVLALRGGPYRTVIPGPAFWPSWSPDATRIAYSTSLRHGTARAEPQFPRQIWIAAVNGSWRRRIATGGEAPSWSPNGVTIAYEGNCGVRLVTPRGADVTPGNDRCGIGVLGRPTWSPDGAKIAIEARYGIFVMNANGTHLRLVSVRTSTAHYGAQPGRPSWRPLR